MVVDAVFNVVLRVDARSGDRAMISANWIVQACSWFASLSSPAWTRGRGVGGESPLLSRPTCKSLS